jgi:hypothetical protein
MYDDCNWADNEPSIRSLTQTISIYGSGGAGRVRYIITINGNIFYGTRHVLWKLYQDVYTSIVKTFT